MMIPTCSNLHCLRKKNSQNQVNYIEVNVSHGAESTTKSQL